MKFAKYLPHSGVQPIILTRKNIAYHSPDEELSQEVKNVQVIRTESVDPARFLYIFGMKKYQAQAWHMPIRQTIHFPDNKVGWIPFAYVSSMRIEYDAIFVTAPPFSSFILAYYVARRTDKPLILDFRDAWLEYPFLPYKGRAKKKFVSYWEEKITNFASLIIVVDENIKDALIKKYPHLEEKISVIPNGYDPDDFIVTKKPAIFTISYLGTIREERNPENFLSAVNMLMHDKKISEKDIKVKFIGHVEEYYLRKIKKFTFVNILGHLPYHHALQEFSSSHLGIMITTGSSYFFPSRQNEYLASELPVIVCGKSKGIHLLEQAFKKGYPGWIYEYNDITGIKNKVFEVYKSFKQGKIIKGKIPFTEYTRKNLTKKLVDLIKKI